MHFDWYQATIPENPITLVDSVFQALAPDGRIEEGRGRHNYHQSFTVRDSLGDRVAVVLAGGPNGHPNVASSGAATDGFVSLVRSNWPDHRVTRFDAAEDFCAEGAWESLEGLCRAVAAEHRVKGRAIVPDCPEEGRTYYMGASTSDVRVRLYEKTAEARKKLPEERWGEIPNNWVRLETQVRPRKDFKSLAAKVGPEIAWGFAGWTAELAARALKLEVERITMQAARESDLSRGWRYMLQQYGNVLRQMHHELGSWECLGLTIGEDLSRMARKPGP